MLTVADLSLERLGQRTAVDEHVATDDTDVGTLREDVEQSSYKHKRRARPIVRLVREWGCLKPLTLSGARLAHKGCHPSGSNKTVDIAEQTTRVTLDHYVVCHTLPAENVRCDREGIGGLLVLLVGGLRCSGINTVTPATALLEITSLLSSVYDFLWCGASLENHNAALGSRILLDLGREQVDKDEENLTGAPPKKRQHRCAIEKRVRVLLTQNCCFLSGSRRKRSVRAVYS